MAGGLLTSATATPPPDGGRPLLVPAVVVCLVRAITASSLAGYSVGQVLGRHSGPALVPALTPGSDAALFGLAAAVCWVELALLQTRPRAGLVLSAVQCAGVLAAGLYATATDVRFWLLPTLVLVVPPLATLGRPAAWRVADRPWRRPVWRRTARLVVVHAAGTAALLLLWVATPTASVALRWAATVAVLVVWSTLAAHRVRVGLRGTALPPADLVVTLQPAIVVGLAVFSWSTVG